LSAAGKRAARLADLSLAALLALAASGCVKDDLEAPPAPGAGLVINEFLASNDGAGVDEHGEADDWVELYNPTAGPLPLGGLLLTDDLSDPAKFVLAAGDSLLGAGEFCVVWCDNQPEQGAFHAPFALSASGEDVGLAEADGSPLDAYRFGPQQTDVSEGRSVDGGLEWVSFDAPTPGFSNASAAAPAPRLVVNELLASNVACCADEHGEHDDWIELYNAGDGPAALNGLYLSDDAAEPLKWRLEPAADTTLAPGAFCLVWCDGAGAAQGAFHAGFALAGSGEAIVLTAADGATVLDQLEYGVQQDDVAWGRDPDGSANWTTFAAPTPGAPNLFESQPLARLVVNEFLASNDACCPDEHGEHDDWLELYNAGDAAVRLNGLYLSDDAAEPLKWRLEPAADTLLAPGAFCVVWCDNATSAQGAFHAGFALSGGGEDIVLTAADGAATLDQLAYDAQASDVSSGRSPDGGANWTTFAAPTPGGPNHP